MVDATARNVEGLPLEEPIAFEFSTVGYLNVRQVVPAPGSDELDPNTVVTVVFGRPVVPLTAISRQSELPTPLTFMPPVRGEGEWLNTSIYLFRPEEGFLPATHYKARVAAGLTDTTGGVLAEDYTWEFTTIQPVVLYTQPHDDFNYLGPSDVISMTFNQPMDHTSAQTSFSLMVDDEPVDGTFRWSGVETSTDRETMVFVPGEPLPRSTEFKARLVKGALSQAGNMGTSATKTWTFRSVRSPGIVEVIPEDGEKDAEPGSSVRFTFSSPMQLEGFMDHLSIRPQVTKVYTYWSEYNTKLAISFQQDPATPYSISLDADTSDQYGATLGEAARVRFTTGDLRPYAVLNSGSRLSTFNAYTDTVVYASHRNVSRLDLSLYELQPAEFRNLQSSWSARDKFVPDEDDLVRRWSRKIQAPRNELHLARLALADSQGDALPPGIYYLELSAPEAREAGREYKPSQFIFVKSRLNLTLKQTRSEVLLWATDLASGQPVAGLPVTLYQDTVKLEPGGSTGVDGLFVAEVPIEDLWEDFVAVTGEPGDNDFSIAYNGWSEGISPWSFDVASEFWANDHTAYLYTDRPIYRPGQTVYFKGIVRADDDARYALPGELSLAGQIEAIDSVQVRIEGPRGTELFKRRIPLNDMGTLHADLQLDEEASLGTYYLEIQEPDHDLFASTRFQVAEYKKPEFQVSVDTGQDAYLDGDEIHATAEATYYFGGPVTDADVHWSVLSSGYSFRYPLGGRCPRYSWTDYEWGSYEDGASYGSYGGLLAEGDTRPDDAGRIAFEVPADISQKTQSQIFVVEASVTDLNGQQVSSRTAAIVHQAEFYAGIAPRGYLAEIGEEKQVDLLTVDWDGEPVSGTDLTVVFMEHRWYSVRRQAEDGQYYWDWSAEDTPVLTTTVTTDEQGTATAAFTPKKAGSYRVRAIGQDSHANQVRSSAYFWVWGGSEHVHWRRESNNRIELIADKDEYTIGDVAEILVPSPYTGTVQALVTVERGHIMEMEVHELQSNTEVLRVPITEEHMPNAFVSVLIVQGMEEAPDGLATFKMGLVKLPVSVESRELNISLSPDKDVQAGEAYGPRQTATYDVLVTDHQGEPVEAELSLRLADLAVLSLADEPGPTLLETFWRDRGLGVRTSLPLVVAMEPYNREIAPGVKGGGGGDGDGLLRSRFADTAFWDPVVRTDQDGRAQAEVQLPDNLTTWRMQARGITADTRVGRAEMDIISTLDLLVRPVLPRFFVAGDEAEIATIVHNNSDEPLDVQVKFSTEGLALDGPTSAKIEIPAGDQVKVTWPVKALPGDEVTVRMSASARDLYDSREDTLPVYRYSTPEVMATAGHLSEPGYRQEIVQLPSEFDPTQGELTVQLDGSLAAASKDAVEYLEHYPYECVEQTVSRFLPNVVTWQALDKMGIERPELRQALSQMVGVGLQRLYNQQHYDGGWGWWVSDESNPYLTAYVLQGMIEAHRAGFVVDQDVVAKAAAYLRGELPSVSQVETHWEANRLAYQLYVLAEHDATFDQEAKGELGLAIRLYGKRHLLSRYGQAMLAVALSLLEPADPGRTQALLDDLLGDAVTSATGFHWEEAEPDYWNMNTDIRTTAIVIWALSRLEPGPGLNEARMNEVLPGAVRWLMAMRQEGYWQTTQATAWSLLGLVEYMRASGELHGDYGYRVYLNGEEWASGDVSKETIDQSLELQVEIARLLAEEGNRLVIERHPAQAGQTGEGQLYYTAHLRYYLPADHVQALDRGILVARQYSPVDEPREYVSTARVGDLIRVKLTIVAPTDLHYVVVEDPLPAGFEGLDPSLKTTSIIGERPELRNVTAEEESTWFRRHGWGWWWFSHSEMRDEKVALFAQYLPRGTYEYTYLMRASVPGEFLVMPSTAYEMYYPEVFGRSDGGKFTVEPVD